MTISEILDKIDDMVEKAWNLPLSGGKCAMSVNELEGLIDRIRVLLPKEIKQANLIVSDRNDIISDAKKEAQSLISDAQINARRLIDNDEITQMAKKEAKEILTKAHSQSNEIRRSTNEYINKVLAECEGVIGKNLQDLKGAHNKFKTIAKK